MSIRKSAPSVLGKIAAIAIVGAFVTLHAPVTGATTIPDIPIGQNHTFAPAAVNGQTPINCGGAVTCSYDFNTANAHSSATLTDTTATADGEQSIGYQYRLVQACSNQSTAAPFTIQYNYNYALTTNKPLLVTGTATPKINAHVRSGDTAIPVTAVVGSGSGTFTYANAHVAALGTLYETGLGAESRVTLTDTPIVPGETIGATADVTLGAVTLDFKDTFQP